MQVLWISMMMVSGVMLQLLNYAPILHSSVIMRGNKER